MHINEMGSYIHFYIKNEIIAEFYCRTQSIFTFFSPELTNTSMYVWEGYLHTCVHVYRKVHFHICEYTWRTKVNNGCF